MASLLTFRAEIAPDLDVLWDEERPPMLLFLFEDDEHDRLMAAGGPERWEYADIPIATLVDFLFDHKPHKRGKTPFACAYSRPGPGRVRMRVSYRGKPIMEREYDDDVCHSAIRLCGHGKAFGELCDAVMRDRGRSFRQDLDALIKGTPHAVTTTGGKPPATVPRGPLRSAQVRLFAVNMSQGGTLPPTLSSEAKEQILAYARSAGMPIPDAHRSSQKTA